MISFTTFVTLTIAALAAALPSARLAPRGDATCTDDITATLFGAADAEFTVQIPCSGAWTPITNPLSISHIQTSGGPCTFSGIDGGSLSLAWAGYEDFGPPQTIVGAICGSTPY